MNRRTPKSMFSVPSLVQDVIIEQAPTQNAEKEQLIGIMLKYTNKQIKKDEALQKLADLEKKLSTPA